MSGDYSQDCPECGLDVVVSTNGTFQEDSEHDCPGCGALLNLMIDGDDDGATVYLSTLYTGGERVRELQDRQALQALANIGTAVWMALAMDALRAAEAVLRLGDDETADMAQARRAELGDTEDAR